MLAYALGILAGFLITVVVIYYSYPNTDYPCNCPDPVEERKIVQDAILGCPKAQDTLKKLIERKRPDVPYKKIVQRLFVIAFVTACIAVPTYFILNKYQKDLLRKLQGESPSVPSAAPAPA